MLTLNDADYENDDIESPVSIKILKFTNGLLIFAEDYTYSIDTVFKLANSSNDSQKEGAKHKSIFFNEDVEIEIPNFWIEIGEDHGCTDVEAVLNKIIEALFFRLESFTIEIDEDAKECMDHCKSVKPDERVDFMVNITSNSKRLIFFADLIDPKIKVFEKLIKAKIITQGMKYYLRSFLSKTVVLKQRLRMSKSMLSTADAIYSVLVDQALHEYSERLNEVSRYFSSISVIFLPLNLLTAYFGMNCRVPGESETDYNAFYIICSIIVGFLIIFPIIFRLMKWI